MKKERKKNTKSGEKETQIPLLQRLRDTGTKIYAWVTLENVEKFEKAIRKIKYVPGDIEAGDARKQSGENRDMKRTLLYLLRTRWWMNCGGLLMLTPRRAV